MEEHSFQFIENITEIVLDQTTREKNVRYLILILLPSNLNMKFLGELPHRKSVTYTKIRTESFS